jgi:hypothetical protein
VLLIVGASSDPVIAGLLTAVRRTGLEHALIDEDAPASYQLARYGDTVVVRGPGCRGTRHVGSVFVRHAAPRTALRTEPRPLSSLRGVLDAALQDAPCVVANRPGNASSNYSKAYQLRILSFAGFDTPLTMVTNDPETAGAFLDAHGRVIVKGASNVPTFARVIGPADRGRLARLRAAPVQLQEYVEGVDHRVHVVGTDTFVTQLESHDPDYRRGAMANSTSVVAHPSSLPAALLERCVAITRELGLVVSGIDFKEAADGRIVALEVNPYPQFTFYEGRSGQPITRAVVDCLARDHTDQGSGLVA